MTPSRIAMTLAGSLALAVVGAVTLYSGSGGGAVAQQLPSGGRPAAPQALAATSQSPAACVCAPPTTLAVGGTNLVHCQCGAATCVVGEYITGQAKSYSLECVK